MTEAQLFLLAKVQGFTWTLFDGACVCFVLLIMDEVRFHSNRERASERWVLLFMSFVVFPAVVNAPNRRVFFNAEVIAVSLQFAALMLCLSDYKIVMKTIEKIKSERREISSGG